MKVLMLSTDSTICRKGSEAESRMIEYGTLFDELHVVVLTRGGETERKISGNVFLYPTNTANKLLYCWNTYGICGHILKKDKNFIVTSQDAMNNFLVFLLRMQFSFVFQVQIHTDFLSPHFIKSAKNILHYLGYRLGLYYADCIRVVSKKIASALSAKNYQLKATPIVLPIWIDVEKIQTAQAIELKKKYSHFNYFILWVGRMEKEKNAVLALSTLKEVLKQNSKACLVMVGDGKQRPYLESLAQSYKLGEHVIFEGWRNDLASYYGAVEALLVTSLYEGYGRQIVEARIAGLPVVSTSVGVAEEVGAHVVEEDARLLAQTLLGTKDAPRAPYSYPYRDRKDYLTLYKKTFTQCLKKK
jgi:glycosyltransferase involved in cell wall biosynthesis